MYSLCRDPKTQNSVGDSLCADDRLEVKNTWIRTFHVQQGRYGHQVHVETIPVWTVCEELKILSSNKVLGPSEYPLYTAQGLLTETQYFLGGRSVAIISYWRRTVDMKTVATFSCTPYLSLENLKRGRNYPFYFRTMHPRGGSHLPLRCCFWVPAHATTPWFRWIA
jgi:hypothetical protein